MKYEKRWARTDAREPEQSDGIQTNWMWRVVWKFSVFNLKKNKHTPPTAGLKFSILDLKEKHRVLYMNATFPYMCNIIIVLNEIEEN